MEHFDYFEPLLENLENGNYLKTSAFGLLEHVLGFEVPKGRGGCIQVFQVASMFPLEIGKGKRIIHGKLKLILNTQQ